MTTYNTGNPVGSTDARDLYDNAQNLDTAVNSAEPTFTDRLGKVRPTLASATDPSGFAQTALDAKAAAEAARDAAQLAAGVYATTDAGLAATTNGQYFNVPASSANDSLILYLNSSGTAVEVKRYPSSRGVYAVADAVADPIRKDKQQLVGVLTPAAGSSSGGANTWVFSGAALRNGLLEEFNIHVSSAQSAKIKIFRRVGFKNVTELSLVHDIPVALASGLNTFSYADGTLARYDIYENDLIGVYVSLSISYTLPATADAPAYSVYSGDRTANIFDNPTDVASAVCLQFNAKIRYTETATDSFVNTDRENFGANFSVGEYDFATTEFDSAQSGYYVHCLDVEFRQSTVMTQVKLRSNAKGVVNLLVLSPHQGGYRISRNVPLLAPSSGVHIFAAGTDFPVDVEVPKGGLVGTYSAILYNSTYHQCRLRIFYVGSDLTYWPADGVFPSYAWPVAFPYLSGIANSQLPQIKIDFALQQSPKIVSAAEQYLTVDEFDGAYGPVNFVGDSWSQSGGKITSTATGLDNQLLWSTGEAYLSQLTMRVRFTFDAAGSAIYVFKGGLLGSLITLDMTGNAITLHNLYNGGASAPAAYSTRACTVTFQTGRTYIAELTKDFKDFTFTVTDSVTGASDSISIDGYVVGQTAGFANGQPGVAAKSGVISVEKFEVFSSKKAPQVICFGDSITEGTGASKTTAWANRVALTANGLASGIGGTTSYEVLYRVQRELNPFSTVRYAIILIGTNDTDVAGWKRNIGHIYESCMVRGVTPIFGTLPPEITDTNPVLDMNPWLRASGYRIVDFARALTVNGDGTTRDATKYADELHPNEAGHLAMYNRVRLDVPELFD